MDNLLHLLARLCNKKKWQIATAESCTGGLVAKLITDCAGSSSWFERGFVTYSNLAKEQMLGIDRHLIDTYGAVSVPVAEAMASGVLMHSQAQFSLAITGIAGPGGGSDSKPVGTVCFAWAFYEQPSSPKIQTRVNDCLFDGDRQSIRTQSAAFALQELYRLMTDQQ